MSLGLFASKYFRYCTKKGEILFFSDASFRIRYSKMEVLLLTKIEPNNIKLPYGHRIYVPNLFIDIITQKKTYISIADQNLGSET